MDEKEQSVEIGTDKSEETLLTQWQTCVEMAMRSVSVEMR